MIKLEKVNKYYYKGKPNQIHVINDTNMELPSHGVVSFLGPSGCGKTTLLNSIGGLDKISSGKIYIDDECINGKRTSKIDTIRNSKIGYIFQNFNLFDERTVFENVALSLRMIGIKDKSVIAKRVNYCLRTVGLYQFRNKNTNALSGGQRQRVAIARAIVKNPSIIIADEPTGNLDSANTLEVMNVIKSISKDRLVVLVTHERKIAEFYSDFIVELQDGTVVEAYKNDASKYLDYQLENQIYLQDMPVHNDAKAGDVNIGVYGDESRKADIKIVFKGANLYIDTGGAYNIIGEDTNVELIDDHYTPMDESVFDENRFDGQAYLPENFTPKYTSVYTIKNMMLSGWKSLVGFKKMKKVLLLGFVFAAMFAFVGISNIAGILNVEDKDFLKTNANYITVANSQKTEDVINKAAAVLAENGDGGYVIPGTSKISVDLPLDDYLQTQGAKASVDVSLTYSSMLKADQIVYGRMPESASEVVLDKFIINDFIKKKSGKSIGLVSAEDFVGRKIKINNLGEYTIVGVSNSNGPNLFVDSSQAILFLTNANAASKTDDSSGTASAMMGEESGGSTQNKQSTKVKSFDLRSSNYELKKGSNPTNDYEVVVPYSHINDMELNKTIDTKIAGKGLKVVGFYKNDNVADIYYTTANTVRIGYINGQNSASVYVKGDGKLSVREISAKLKDAGLSPSVNYDKERSTYVNKMLDTNKSTLIVAAILLAIALIEMYLMLRSSFLARIKEVGIMRAIGLKKKDVYRMFAGEIIVISTVTAIPGLALIYYIMSNVIKITPLLESTYMVTPQIAITTFFVVLLFNLIVGLLPVFNTLRKTPAEILARNDV